MSKNLGTNDAPPATRAARPGWRDPRLWIGLALVAGSVLVGAKVLGGADDTIEVWAASSDLASGQEVTEDDLTARRVRFADDGDVDHYLLVGERLPDGATLARAVSAGELLPARALGDDEAGLLEVPVWAPADAVPARLGAGAVVDIWVTPASGAGKAGAERVLDDVVVIAAPRSQDEFGPSGNRQVLIGVEDEDEAGVALVLAAAKENRLALTREG